MGKKLSKETKDFICEHYNDMSSTKLAEICGCCRGAVTKIWFENGLKGKEKCRQYYFDFDYFNELDTSNKAYIFGLLASDGNLYKRSEKHQGQIQIILHKDDEHILNDIKSEFGTDKPLTYHKNYCTLTLVSDKLYNDLLDLGLYPNKTKTLNIKNLKIPSDFISDFIRGYFDGDGSIYISRVKEKILPNNYVICFSGYEHNLKEIQQILKENNINSYINIDKRKDKYTVEGMASLVLHKKSETYKLIKFMYKNTGLCFKRKYDKAMDFIKLVDNQ